jgi:hypothetical protein
MTDQQHRATPEQWETLEHYVIAIRNPSIASCILELRDRIERLEASAGIGQSTTPANTSAPADSLVERVADAIVSKATSAGIVDDRPARAAIREVASWLRSELVSRAVADRLEQEAKR